MVPNNFVERPLVLIVQDEMMAQAHDTKSKSWVFNDQHALRKKRKELGMGFTKVMSSVQQLVG